LKQIILFDIVSYQKKEAVNAIAAGLKMSMGGVVNPNFYLFIKNTN
jgi:hypothetical protein